MDLPPDRWTPAPEYRTAGWVAPRPPFDGVSIAALVVALLALGPVAIGLGVWGIVRTRPGVRRGRGLAITGVALGALQTIAVIGGVFAIVQLVDDHRDLDSDVASRQQANAVQVVVGNCLESLGADGRVSTVIVVPCDEPHAAQVISRATLGTSEDEWPGRANTDRLAVDSCLLPDDVAAAGFHRVVWGPLRSEWESSTAEAMCIAAADSPWTGSLLDGTASTGS